MRKKFIGKPPLFRTGKPDRSPYYWWWMFLRRNQDYLRCCENNGQGKMASLYKDFGDVGDGDFKKWWRRVGEDLFSEPPVRSLEATDIQPDYMVVFVPLTLNKGTLRKRFRQLLEKTHTRKKGGKVFAHSLARYPLSAKPVPRALDAALRVYDLWKKHKKDWTLWQIGEAANVFPDGQTKPTDTPGTIRDKRTAMASTVRRYITTAERYVENVGKGRFPVK